MMYEFMNVNSVADYIQNIGTVHATNMANELRATYEEMDRELELTSVLKQWMIDNFEDGEYGFRVMECKVTTIMIIDPFTVNSDSEYDMELKKHIATLA